MRGKCVHRWLGLGVLTVVAALTVSSVAQAAGAPRPPLTGVHAALENKADYSTSGLFGPEPDVVERAVLRSQAISAIGTDSHERTSSTVQGSGYTPQAEKAMGDRWAAYADRFSGSTDDGTTATQTGSMPGWAIGAYNRSVIEKTGYTPEALQAMGDRWSGYAARFDGGNDAQPVGDANNRVDLPATTPTASVADDSGFNWTDVAFGALLGIALVGLGAIGAFAMRSHGRVPQA